MNDHSQHHNPPLPQDVAASEEAFLAFVRNALDGLVEGDPIVTYQPQDKRLTQHASDPDARMLWGQVVHVGHDEREAPYIENDSILMSRSDENGMLAEVFARPAAGSPLRGIGLDLSSHDDFGGAHGQEFARLILFPSEYAQVSSPSDSTAFDPMGSSRLFAAKEAAFKSTAAPLRAHYAQSDEKIFYEVRDLRATPDGHVVGDHRIGHADEGLALLGISEIRTCAMELDQMELVLALAF